jgi:hypothetical protein
VIFLSLFCKSSLLIISVNRMWFFLRIAQAFVWDTKWYFSHELNSIYSINMKIWKFELAAARTSKFIVKWCWYFFFFFLFFVVLHFNRIKWPLFKYIWKPFIMLWRMGKKSEKSTINNKVVTISAIYKWKMSFISSGVTNKKTSPLN